MKALNLLATSLLHQWQHLICLLHRYFNNTGFLQTTIVLFCRQRRLGCHIAYRTIFMHNTKKRFCCLFTDRFAGFNVLCNVQVRLVSGQQQKMVALAGSDVGIPPGALGEEVRVDCCLMARDGKNVITGSSSGPPQVWDMQVGWCD